METILEDQRKKFQEFLQEQVVTREDILLDGQTTLSTVLLSLIFRAVAEPRNSGKSREIHKNTQNTAKFGKNLIK